jgi:hypothetical protein
MFVDGGIGAGVSLGEQPESARPKVIEKINKA